MDGILGLRKSLRRSSLMITGNTMNLIFCDSTQPSIDKLYKKSCGSHFYSIIGEVSEDKNELEYMYNSRLAGSVCADVFVTES